MKFFTGLIALFTLMLLVSGSAFSQADPIGGPYTVDTNTVVLFHFDGNTVNAAAAVGKTADSALHHTTISNGITFIPNAGVAGMGQCVRINNGAVTDSSFLTLAETLAVDLTGDWTIEAWAQILTFGDVNDYKWVPRIVMKPGQDEFWHPNYWMEMWGDSRTFQTGFYTPNGDFISGTSPINMFVPGEWVHLTFIRDTTRGFIAMLVHDSNKNLKSFTARGFDPKTQVPRPTLNPIHMGWAGGILNTPDKQSGDSWLDGYLDEIRISKVVRNFAGPPLITNTAVLVNQPATATSYDVSTTVQPFTYGNTIASTTLHYYTNKWDSVAMSGAGNLKSGTIPGQPFGSLVKYYISAIDNAGFRSTDPQNAENVTNATVYSFYIYQPNVQTLDLTFEEGPGYAPVDHSPSNSTVVLPGRIPDYATDAKEGSYALKLVYTGWGTPSGGTVPSVDSNWVEVSSPFLSAVEFSLSAWLKPDSLIHAIRVINLPGDSTDFFNNNYEFEIRSMTGGFGWVGRYSAPDGTLYSLQCPALIVPHKWYHLTWERRSVTADTGIVALVVRDENDNLLWKGQITGAKPPLMGGSRTPPGARLRVGRGNPNSPDWYGFIAPFQGEIDKVTVYNYPQSGVTGVGPIPASMPWVFALNQNYPNPFNPSTKIHFEIPKAANTSLVVYDLLGRKVKTIMSDYMHAGTHDVTWYGNDDRGVQVASGVYFYKLTSGTMTKTLKMMLVR